MPDSFSCTQGTRSKYSHRVRESATLGEGVSSTRRQTRVALALMGTLRTGSQLLHLLPDLGWLARGTQPNLQWSGPDRARA